MIFRRDADTIVSDGKSPTSLPVLGRELNGEPPLRTPVFDRVANEILEQLLKMEVMHMHDG